MITLNPYFEAKNEQIGLKTPTAPSRAGDAFYFNPLFDKILTHFTKFMEAYQAQEEEK